MDIRTASKFFLRFSFFLVLIIVISFLFPFFVSQASYLSYNHLFLDFLKFFNFFSVPLKHV